MYLFNILIHIYQNVKKIHKWICYIYKFLWKIQTIQKWRYCIGTPTYLSPCFNNYRMAIFFHLYHQPLLTSIFSLRFFWSKLFQVYVAFVSISSSALCFFLWFFLRFQLHNFQFSVSIQELYLVLWTCHVHLINGLNLAGIHWILSMMYTYKSLEWIQWEK